MLLAPFYEGLFPSNSPAWVKFAQKYLFDHLVAKGMVVGTLDDDNLLFIGENSPDLHHVALSGRKYSILLLLQEPTLLLSDNVLMQAESLFCVSYVHSYILGKRLQEKYEGVSFHLKHWEIFPTPFEPINRNGTPLIGIMEPDFNYQSMFARMYSAAVEIFSTQEKPGYSLAFYTYNIDTFNYINELTTAKLPLYHLPSEMSPINDITSAPNAVMSMDIFKYNPVMNAWAQRIPIVRMSDILDKENHFTHFTNALMQPKPAITAVDSLMLNFVNQLKKIIALESSSSIDDRLLRSSLMGDLYGDYSKCRHIHNGTKSRSK